MTAEDEKLQQHIIEALRQSGHPMDAKEIWAQIGGDVKRVAQLVRNLAVRRVVLRVGHRTYRRMALYALPDRPIL